MDYSLRKRLLVELFGTFWLVFCGCGAAVLAAKFPGTGIGFVGVAFAFGLTVLTVGLCLTLIHLVSIPVTNTSVNPARSTGPALFVGGAALGQLWLFWVAPIVGAVASGAVYRAWHVEQPQLKAIGEEERPIKHAASRFSTRTGT
jgi:aquaporin Z